MSPSPTPRGLPAPLPARLLAALLLAATSLPAIAGAEEDMLGFETITFAPIARDLVEVALLSPAETDWLDAYHAEVLAKLAPGMAGEERDWLAAACAPLDRTPAALAA